MMECVGIAMLLMVVATVAAHLGLSQAIAQVVLKIFRCHKCLSFWLALAGLLAAGCPVVLAAPLSLFAAYVSNWFVLLLIILNDIYDKIWQRLNK
ncbi:MAG: hypothetical protein IKN59_04490 [Paludibacteraceae bacterium]|nr:hypothetical protein [Paludibacteraceae bacterium]